MVNTKDFIKIKEYSTFVLFQHKALGYKECFLKVDLIPPPDVKEKWKR